MRVVRAMIVCLCLAAAPAPFSYIAVHRTALKSTNGVRIKLQGPAGYRLLRPTSRHATFEGHPYEVTLAALAGKGGAIMFHAEKVTDDSGASNYDALPASSWRAFHRRSQCASIASGDVAVEHDLKWLADRGWSPIGNLALEQHLKSTPDHNQEVVISLIAKVKGCADKQAIERVLGKLRSQVRVTPL